MVKRTLTLLWLLCSLASPILLHAHNDAENIINKLHQVLLDNMKNGATIGYAGRRQSLQNILPEIFDFPLMTKVVFGGYWQTFSNQQQIKLIELCTDFSIANYARNFNQFNGEFFKIVDYIPQKKGRILIKTKLINQDDMVNIDYLLRSKTKNWIVINIIFNGINDLAIRRVEYNQILSQQDGYEKLINILRQKIMQLEN